MVYRLYSILVKLRLLFHVCEQSSVCALPSGRPLVTMLRVHVRKAKEATETLYPRRADI